MKKIFLLQLLFLLMMSCQESDALNECENLISEKKLEEQNKELASHWLSEVDKENFAVVDELLAKNCKSHYGDDSYDNAWVLRSLEAFPEAFSQYEHIIDDMYAEGDRVCVKMTVKVNHTGDFANIPPTGKTITYDAYTIYRFEEGKIIEMWWDTNAVMGLIAKLEGN
jgi:predicted ester cyclase